MNKLAAIEKLTAFKENEKFASSEWEDRGLNPSGRRLRKKLERLFNNCAAALINAVESDSDTEQLKNILEIGLQSFRSNDYDTEEKEFICDYFFELAAIVEVDFNENLDAWMYGTEISFLLKVISSFKGKETIVETLSQDCTRCRYKLETFILKKQEGIPDHAWSIVQCNLCEELNIVSVGPDVKKLRFETYKLIEQLKKSEYSEQEALTRLEQIKFFRKE